MKQRFKSVLAILLALTMVLGLAACGGGGETTEAPTGGIGGAGQGTAADDGYIYVAEFLDVDLDASSIDLIAASGDTLYVTYRTNDFMGGMGIATMRTDGTGATSIWESTNQQWEEGETTHSEFQDVSVATLHPDGGLLALRYEHGGSWGPEESSFEESFVLMHLGSDGSVLQEADLAQVLDLPAGSHFGVSRIGVFSDGRILVNSWEALYVLSADWTLERRIEWEASDFIVTAADQVLVSVWREGAYSTQVFPFDLATGEIDETDGAIFTAELNNAVIGAQYDLYVGTQTAVFGFDLATRRSTLLFDWLDIDMISSFRFAASDTGEIFFFEQNWDEMGGGDSGGTLVRLTRRPIDEVPQRTEIVLGALSVDWDLRREIVAFNQRNQNYRIRVREYWNWTMEEPADAIARLNTDIITGNAPDIIDFGWALSFERYARRGLLADIGALLDADATLSRSDLVENVRHLLEIDGTLYTTASQFTVQTLVGSSARIGADMGWTMAEFMDMADSLPQGSQMFDRFITRQRFMDTVLGTNLGQFIDRETGEADFDSELFRSYLAFAQGLPTDEELHGEDGMWPGDLVRPLPAVGIRNVEEPDDEEADYEDLEPINEGDIGIVPPIADLPPDAWDNPYLTGEVLLQDWFLFGFHEIQFMEEQFGGPVTLIGYPTEQGIGSVITPRTLLGISASSDNIDAAWSFVRTVLTPDYQRGNSFQFATNQTVLNEQIASAMEPIPMWEEEDAPGATQAQVDQVMALINQTTQLSMMDTTVLEMITAETLPFFAGDRSVEETARIIQSRVQTYLSEIG